MRCTMKEESTTLLTGKKLLFSLTLFGLMMLTTATFIYAHAAVLWCYVENDKVYVEAFFMGGKKVQNGQIYVVDAGGNKILEGKTNTEGLFNFTPASKDALKIILKLDTGHGSEFEITKQDFIDAAAAESQKK